MKLLAMSLGCALALSAQDSDQVLMQKKMADAKAQMAQTFTFVTGEVFNGNPVKGQPYSAEAVTETTQTLADGNRIVNRHSTMIYRDSDGRERREETIVRLGNLKAEGPAKIVFISDPVLKMSYTLHPDAHVAEQHPSPKLLAGPKGESSGAVTLAFRAGPGGVDDALPATVTIQGHELTPGAPDSKVEQLGTRVLEGVAAEGTRTTTTIPAGEIGNDREIDIVSERWFSQELGVVVMSTRSDPRSGVTVYKLTNISREEPAQSLFRIPADYRIVDVGSPNVKVKEE